MRNIKPIHITLQPMQILMKVYSNDMDQDHMHSNCVSTIRVENGKMQWMVGMKLIYA